MTEDIVTIVGSAYYQPIADLTTIGIRSQFLLMLVETVIVISVHDG